MSADRRSQCPYCYKKHYAQVNEMEKELEDSYAKISLTEWMDKKKSLERVNKNFDSDGETLRENWGFYFNEIGSLVVSYGCSCDVCGFEYSFIEQKDIMEGYQIT